MDNDGYRLQIKFEIKPIDTCFYYINIDIIYAYKHIDDVTFNIQII